MRYRKIDQRLWASRTFRSMSEDARALYQYLLTSPHNNALCCYYLPDGYATADIQWDLPRFRAAMDELVRTRRPEDGSPMVVYDPANSLVLVWGQLEKEGLANPNAAKAALKALATMPRRSEIYAEVLAACERLRQPFCKQLTEALRERIPDPRAQVQEQEQERRSTPAAPAPPPAPAVIEIPLIPKDGSYPVSQAQVDEWTLAYPGVDVMAELRKIVAWSRANPTKRKTRRGAARFLNLWLSKAQDRPPLARASAAGVPTAASTIFDHPMQLPNNRAFDGQ